MRPRRRQPRTAGKGLDHHWRTDITSFDPVLRLQELRLEAPHETDLEHNTGLLRGSGHQVALF